MRLERALLALALCFGTAYAFLTPPFQVPDEPQHFFRAFEVSEGRLLPIGREGQSGDWLPESLPRVAADVAGQAPFHPGVKVPIATIHRAFADRLEPQSRVFVPFLTSAYSFVPYLPAAAGIRAARFFSDSVLVLFYAGRLANVLVGGWLFFAALRSAPLGKPLFLLLALAPMAMFEMASVSADAMTNGVGFLFTALALAFAFAPEPPPGRAVLGRLILVAVLLGLTKPGYVFLTGLVLLAPVERFGSRWRKAAVALGTLGSSLAAAGAWSLAIRNIYPPFHSAGGLDPEKQLSILRSDPIGALEVFASFYFRAAPSLANQYVGKLGWIDTHLPRVFVVAFLASLLVVAATCGCEGPSVRRAQRLVLFGVLAASLLWMTALLYVVFTPPGAPYVGSTQGRYFLPLGPVAFLLLVNRRLCIGWSRRASLLIGWGLATEIVALAAIVERFYL